MLVNFRPHKPSSSFLDKLQHLVSEEPGITLCISDSEADETPHSKRPCTIRNKIIVHAEISLKQ